MLIEAGAVPTVFLDAGVEELWRRCRQQAEQEGIERPLHGSPERFGDLYDGREGITSRPRSGKKPGERLSRKLQPR